MPTRYRIPPFVNSYPSVSRDPSGKFMLKLIEEQTTLWPVFDTRCRSSITPHQMSHGVWRSVGPAKADTCFPKILASRPRFLCSVTVTAPAAPLTTVRHNFCFLGECRTSLSTTFGGLVFLESPDLIFWASQISQCLLSAVWHPCSSAAVRLDTLPSTFDKDYGVH